MYIDAMEVEKIKDIFKRLNKSSYTLNKIEKLSTQMVEYEYMIIAKVLVGIVELKHVSDYIGELQQLFPESEENKENAMEVDACDSSKDYNNIPPNIKLIIENSEFDEITRMFNSEEVFTRYDISRQLNLQYFLNIFTCIIKKEIIHRNISDKIIEEISNGIENYSLSEVITNFNKVCGYISKLYNNVDNFWKNKACFFTICYSLYYNFKNEDDIDIIAEKMNAFYECKLKKSNSNEKMLQKWALFYACATEGVNDQKSRKNRDDIFTEVILNQGKNI